VAFVTFTAEKFGGLVRIPTEIDDDSIVPLGQFIARYSAAKSPRPKIQTSLSAPALAADQWLPSQV